MIDSSGPPALDFDISFRRSVITNPKSISDIRNDIQKVISETLTSDIQNILHLTYKHIAWQVVISEKQLTKLDWPGAITHFSRQTTQLTPIVIADKQLLIVGEVVLMIVQINNQFLASKELLSANYWLNFGYRAHICKTFSDMK